MRLAPAPTEPEVPGQFWKASSATRRRSSVRARSSSSGAPTRVVSDGALRERCAAAGARLRTLPGTVRAADLIEQVSRDGEPVLRRRPSGRVLPRRSDAPARRPLRSPLLRPSRCAPPRCAAADHGQSRRVGARRRGRGRVLVDAAAGGYKPLNCGLPIRPTLCAQVFDLTGGSSSSRISGSPVRRVSP